MSREAASGPAAVPPPTRREIFGWCCFDFANSSFTTIIITVVFAPYFVRVVAADQDNPNTLWSLALALSQLIVVIVGPFLGAVADRTGRKKLFLAATTIGCAVPTLLLALTGAGAVVLAFSLVVLANLCFSLGENFSSSFLPELSTPESAGRISGYGWAFGYCGGLVSLLLALVLLQGLNLPATSTFLATGIFFLLAASPTFLLLRERSPRRPWPPASQVFVQGWSDTFRFLRALPGRPALFGFFLAFLAFMMGVTSVIAFASIYGEQRFGFDQAGLVRLFLFLQISAALGALAFGFFQDRFGARPALVVSLLGWLGVCAGGWFSTNATHFTLVAVLAGAVIGSTQSASRALVSTLTETGREGETFGYWGLFGKLAAVLGPLAFGLAADTFQDPAAPGSGMRVALLLNALWFLLGLILLLVTPLHRPARAA